MKFHVFNRKAHYWASAIVALPLLVVIASGILLQLKKDVGWVQPPEQRGTARPPALDYPRILEICRGVPEAGVLEWSDIHRIDTRPSRGLTKVTTRSNWEIQLDSHTGDVLQAAYRRSDIIESIHDGSWFHEKIKYWVFLPAGIVLAFLWFSGIYMFALPYWVKWRRRKA